MLPRLWIFLILLACYVRWPGLTDHFSHFDDLGVAQTILSTKVNPEVALERKKRVLDPQNPQFHSFSFRVSRVMDQLGLLEPLLKAEVLECVPRSWTYAPLQFLLTGFLVRPEHTYRELLFWGRLPSFLFGILALISLVWFYQYFEPKERFPSRLLAITLLGFSWENIIYSNQMESYAISCLSTILLWVGLAYAHRQTTFSKRSAVAMGIIVAFLCYSQYQMLLFVPGFFLTLGIIQLKRISLKACMRNLFLGGGSFLFLFLPLYFRYLRPRVSGALNWNIGPHGEFLFSWPSHATLWDKILYPFQYFGRNITVILQSNVSFIPENAIAYPFITVVLIALFCLGVWGLLRNQDSLKKYITFFLFCSAVVWGFLIVKGSVALSPTRHTLILLPYFVFVIIEGVRVIAKFFSRNEERAFRVLSMSSSLGVLVLFFMYFGQVQAERRDPFDPSAISRKLKSYQANTLIGYGWTLNAELMSVDLPEIHRYSYNDSEDLASFEKKIGEGHLEAFSMISHRARLPAFLKSKYEVVYQEEKFSKTEIDFLPKTQNGANNFFFYILRKNR